VSGGTGGANPQDDAAADDLTSTFPIAGASSQLTVTSIEPAAGPASGGITAVLRGSGLSSDVEVAIGGVAVPEVDITADGTNRLQIVVPAGKVGPADVSVKKGEMTAVLPDGFVYNALAASPQEGAVAGGSLVDLTASSGSFASDVVVEFGGVACTDLNRTSPQRLTCKTPAHAAGVVDVVARSPSDSSAELIAQQGYTFIETANAVDGGLSGDPIEGTLNVTVISDGESGNFIPKALVLLGDDPRTAQRGITDARGAVTFSVPGLEGPVSVHAIAKCFQRGSIVDFDARNITLFLSPAFDPSCTDDTSSDTGTSEVLVATVTGELVFPGDQEFAVNSWDVVPAPRDNEIRVAYVYTTRSSAEASAVPADGVGAAFARLEEATATPGKRGYIYRITARNGGLAVYALAGIERTDTGEFTPYVTGVAHNVVTMPGEEAADVDISMSITLDRELDVQLSGLPASFDDGPDAFRVSAHLDLGGEGVIVREVNSRSYDSLTRYSSTELFRFTAEPALVSELADASYLVTASYFSASDSGPYTRQTLSGVLPGQEPLVMDGFLGIPKAVSPITGARIPDDRVLRFELTGPTPDMIIVDIYGGDTRLAWTEILPGTTRRIPVPDFSLIEGYSDLEPGFVRWKVTAVRLADFQYNEFQYSYLASRYWTHESVNNFYARR